MRINLKRTLTNGVVNYGDIALILMSSCQVCVVNDEFTEFLESFTPSSLCLRRLASKADRSWTGNGQNQAIRESYYSLQGTSRSSFESFTDNLFFSSSLVPMVITHKTNSESRKFRNTNKVTQPCHPFRIQFCHQRKRTSNNNMNTYKKTDVKSDVHMHTF